MGRAPEEGSRPVEVVAENAARLGELVAADGWPGLGAVGADGADAAWLIARHADLHNELRRTWLPSLEAAVPAGEADPSHLASLVDRIAVVDDRRQAYGTVALVESGRVVVPHMVDVPEELDARRAAVGLPSLAEDAAPLENGEIVPFGPDRQDHPLMRWP